MHGFSSAIVHRTAILKNVNGRSPLTIRSIHCEVRGHHAALRGAALGCASSPWKLLSSVADYLSSSSAMCRRCSKAGLVFAGQDLIQRAHTKACEMLNRCPKTHESGDRLARIVMRLFDQGVRDENNIAWKAINEETVLSGITLLRQDSLASEAKS